MPACSAVVFQGLPCVRLSLDQGDTALVSLHGAQVLSWVSGGRERLYLSPKSLFDGQAAIRGGVPLCFPQFNRRGPLPKHGFARNLPWCSVEGDAAGVEVPQRSDHVAHTFTLSSNAATQRHWPQTFEAALTVSIQPGSLLIALQVLNTDDQPLTFTGALHTYLAVDDISAVRLQGLQGQAEWNALTDARHPAADVLSVNGEFDRVYTAAPQPLLLSEAGRGLQVSQSPSFDQTVVWNPGADACAGLADMPADGYRHMLCVEAARVDAPAVVPAGQTWQGWQRLTLC